MYDAYYNNKLYPCQDKILLIIGELNTKFYLTGGTALSRFYLEHRYSEDLDFFQNDNSSFNQDIDLIQLHLQKEMNVSVQRVGERFRRIFVNEDEIQIKIEFVNDVPFHLGEFQSFPIFQRVDYILSNKITAIIDRDEPKDFQKIKDIILQEILGI